MGAISLVKFNIANNNSEPSLHLINSIINSDPPCCDPGSTAPSVSVSYSYDNGAGECCIVVTGSANTAFELIWPGQSSPWCQTSTNSFGWLNVVTHLELEVTSMFVYGKYQLTDANQKLIQNVINLI